jgi:hypothetical protein
MYKQGTIAKMFNQEGFSGIMVIEVNAATYIHMAHPILQYFKRVPAANFERRKIKSPISQHCTIHRKL